MEHAQVSKVAQAMFLKGAGRKAVIDFLAENGVTGNEAETMATEAYKAVKPLREAALKEKHAEPKPVGGGGIGSIAIGAILIIGGLIATMSTDRIWYGAMIVGAIALFKGIADYIK